MQKLPRRKSLIVLIIAMVSITLIFGAMNFASSQQLLSIFYNPRVETTKVDEAGNRYSGQLRNNQPDGRGTYRSVSGHIYTGEWKNGKRQGQGIIRFSNLSEYEGQFFNDQPDGKGRYVFSRDDLDTNLNSKQLIGQGTSLNNSDFYGDLVLTNVEKNESNYIEYIGKFKEGRRHGAGILKFGNGDTFEGNWQNNSLIGEGKYSSKKGIKYEGKFLNLKMHGYGVLTDPEFQTHQGNWSNNQKSGKGTTKYHDGDTYTGEWFKGRYHGKGTYKWASGNTYEGEFLNDEFNGFGIYKRADGNTYEGEFLNSNFNGLGTYKWADGDIYEGAWLNDMRTGHGKFTWRNGNSYEGAWLNGQRHGPGEFTSGDARTDGSISQIYVNDEIISTKDELCELATINGTWRRDPVNLWLVREAVKKSYNCETSAPKIVDTCPNDPKFCEIEPLCRFATFKGGWETREQFLPYINEARRREVTLELCEKVKGLSASAASVSESTNSLSVTPSVQVKNSCSNTVEMCDNKQLCILAIDDWHWKNSINYIGHVTEAEKRGLSLGDCAIAMGEDLNTIRLNFGQGAPTQILPNAQQSSVSSASRMAMPVEGKIIGFYDQKLNTGLDISAPSGSKVVAAEDGVVAAITKDTDQVPILVVRHADNLLTVYARITDLKVAKGDSVKRGQTLGSVNQGTPAYLHFELRQGFDSIDPIPYLQ